MTIHYPKPARISPTPTLAAAIRPPVAERLPRRRHEPGGYDVTQPMLIRQSCARTRAVNQAFAHGRQRLASRPDSAGEGRW